MDVRDTFADIVETQRAQCFRWVGSPFAVSIAAVEGLKSQRSSPYQPAVRQARMRIIVSPKAIGSATAGPGDNVFTLKTTDTKAVRPV